MKLVLIILLSLALVGLALRSELDQSYTQGESQAVLDRSGQIILLKPNNKRFYSLYATSSPTQLQKWLMAKEDRYFFYHPGINPVSLLEEGLSRLGFGARRGSSTLTQQLVKILLQHETDRRTLNKIVELAYTLTTEIFHSKKELAARYLNSVYFGSRLQGVETASRAYFKTSGDKLSNEAAMQLLATLSNPSYHNPTSGTNIPLAQTLAAKLRVSVVKTNFISPQLAAHNVADFLNFSQSFELEKFLGQIRVGDGRGDENIETTIDLELTQKIRKIVASAMPSLYQRDARNVAVVVEAAATSEILSIVGTPDPTSRQFGQQINMALEPRPIASTIKPFIYLKAFEKGMRPETLIDDREYEFRTADGRILYLKNYDQKYRGPISAAYALANSINVPSVKTLEYVGLAPFGEFLKTIAYSAPEKIIEHQLGIGLGTLPFSLFELTHDYSIFARGGNFSEPRLFRDPDINQQFFPAVSRQIVAEEYVKLVNDILSNRHLATDQFGYVSNLNLPLANYALKTGTSDDWRDSWVIGYTPDFIVGVWVGNADNTSTKELSGQTGAGEIWSRVMELMASEEWSYLTVK